MRKPLNHNLLLQLVAITQKMLIDKAENKHDFLNQYFSEFGLPKNSQGWEEMTYTYFIEPGKSLPEDSVPFAKYENEDPESAADREFFLDRLKDLVSSKTGQFSNYSSLISSTPKNEQGEQQYFFTPSQLSKIFELNLDFSYSYEQKVLSEGEGNTGKVDLTQKDAALDPTSLGNKVLVQSRTGYTSLSREEFDRLNQPGIPAQQEAIFDLQESRGIIFTGAAGNQLHIFNPLSLANNQFLKDLRAQDPNLKIAAFELGKLPILPPETAQLDMAQIRNLLRERKAASLQLIFEKETGNQIVITRTVTVDADTTASFEGKDQENTTFAVRGSTQTTAEESPYYEVTFDRDKDGQKPPKKFLIKKEDLHMLQQMPIRKYYEYSQRNPNLKPASDSLFIPQPHAELKVKPQTSSPLDQSARAAANQQQGQTTSSSQQNNNRLLQQLQNPQIQHPAITINTPTRIPRRRKAIRRVAVPANTRLKTPDQATIPGQTPAPQAPNRISSTSTQQQSPTKAAGKAPQPQQNNKKKGLLSKVTAGKAAALIGGAGGILGPIGILAASSILKLPN